MFQWRVYSANGRIIVTPHRAQLSPHMLDILMNMQWTFLLKLQNKSAAASDYIASALAARVGASTTTVVIQNSDGSRVGSTIDMGQALFFFSLFFSHTSQKIWYRKMLQKCVKYNTIWQLIPASFQQLKFTSESEEIKRNSFWKF